MPDPTPCPTCQQAVQVVSSGPNTQYVGVEAYEIRRQLEQRAERAEERARVLEGSLKGLEIHLLGEPHGITRDMASAELLVALLKGIVRRRPPAFEAHRDYELELMDAAANMPQMYADRDIIEDSWKASE